MTTMPTTTLITGVLLILVGVVGYVATGQESLTALLPAALGLVIAVCGVIARASEGLRMHAMHAALVFALLGALGSIPQVATLPAALGGTADRPAAAYTATAATLICIAFIVLGVRSFIAARKAREAQASPVS